ncbi:MAG TPA: ABC transporter permease [Bryobacteraceae bacterium]|nr:ABC transporter permease [Bryobacteraceae bacterium]
MHLYPYDFRNEFGREMTNVLRRRLRDENALLVWIATLLDLGPSAFKEHCHMLFQDLKYTFRALGRAPVFALATILTLALGIGANVAIFSVVNAVMLQPLPFRDPARLVRIWEMNPKLKIPFFSASALNYLSWKEQSKSFDSISAFGSANLNLTGTGDPERLIAGSLTASLIPMLDIKMLAGRGFLPEEERPGGARVAVISEGMWERRFARDPKILGQEIELNGAKTQIIGVAPKALRFPSNASVWVPLRIDPAQENRGNHVITVVARLRDGVSLAQADAELKAVAQGLEQTYPATNTGWTTRMSPVYEWIVPDRFRSALIVLAGAVSLVLLTACVNVANLLLARAVARSREISVRLALGASRRRLARQLLTESTVIALLGGIAGTGLAYLAVAALKQSLTTFLPRSSDIGVNSVVLFFALVISVVTGLLFGIAPLHQALKAGVGSSLKEGGRGATAGRPLVRRILVVTEVAMATMLVIGAALLIQSFMRLQKSELGFKPDHVLTAQISLPGAKYPPPAQAAFFDRLLERLRGVPGITAAATSSGVPMGAGDYTGMSGRAPGNTDKSPTQLVSADWRMVSADYFRLMNIPLLRGRQFGPEDQAEKSNSIALSALLAKRAYGTEDVVGRKFELERGQRFTIVAVVADVRNNSLENDPRPAMYFPSPRSLWNNMTVVIRTAGEPESATTTLREVVKQIDPLQPIYNIRTLDQWIEQDSAQARSNTMLLSIFGAVSLLLAAIGVYGVLSYSVTQRTSELGIRIALGARTSDVAGLVLRQGMLLSMAGLVAGALGALALQKLLQTVLFGVSARDPWTFVVVLLGLGAVSGLACALPAWRASRIDPLIALRQE